MYEQRILLPYMWRTGESARSRRTGRKAREEGQTDNRQKRGLKGPLFHTSGGTLNTQIRPITLTGRKNEEY